MMRLLRHGWRPGGFTLGLLLAGLTTGLLMLGGAALIEVPAAGAGPAPRCVAFQVGSPFAADTRIHLENAGPERTAVRLDFVDHEGRDAQAGGYDTVLEPGATGDLVFRTPALGAAVKLVASGAGLRAGAEILRDDGGPPETRPAIGCLARSVLEQATAVIP